MNIHGAIEQATIWEYEYAYNHPTHGSDDERTIEGVFTLVGPYVVYSYVSQWMIHTEIWTASSLMQAIRENYVEADKTKKDPSETWLSNRPTGIYL